MLISIHKNYKIEPTFWFLDDVCMFTSIKWGIAYKKP